MVSKNGGKGMSILIRYFIADFKKTKHLSIRMAHFLIPICVVMIFLSYYSYSPWDAYGKVEAFFQILGIGFPFLISLFCVMIAEQELIVGRYQELLSAPRKCLACYSKLLLLILFGLFSVCLTSLLFGIGYFYVLHEQVISFSFYWKASLILLGSSLFFYIEHFFLSLRFHGGVSIGLGMIESLVSALLLTGLGEYIWMYIPSGWVSRLVTQFLAIQSTRMVYMREFSTAMLVCVVLTIFVAILFGIWFYRWEGKR